MSRAGQTDHPAGKAALIYMGTPEFAVPTLRALVDAGHQIRAVVCQPDRPQGRHFRLVSPPVKVAALELGLKVLQPQKIRTAAYADELRQLEPDLIVTAAYGRILPPVLLDLPRRGCLNLHASLLPRYRGAAPIQHAIIAGERETGVTLMLMDEGMDTGAILQQERVPIAPDLTADQLSQLLAETAARMAPGGVAGWLDGALEPQPQAEGDASYAPPLTRESGRIDWQMPARRIADLVRGTQPWPGAWTWQGKSRLKVHRAMVNNDPELLAAAATVPPGTLVSCSGGRLHVACGQGILDLLEIQGESGRRLKAQDCAHNYRPGTRLGEEIV